jgi:hypothetical protein
MTTEDRLRDALSATARLVEPGESQETVVPLRRTRRIGPLAAAAAVVLIGIASVLFNASRNAPPLAPPTPYFVALVEGHDLSPLTVNEAATGKTTASLMPPPGQQWLCVAATANPRVFYAAAIAVKSARNDPMLIKLMIDRAGQAHELSSLRLGTSASKFGYASGCSVSPDGTRVAFPLPPKGGSSENVTGIGIIELSSRRHTTLAVPRGSVLFLSWTADGRYLAFQSIDSQHTYAIRILDMSAPQPANRPPVVLGKRPYLTRHEAPVISGDGRHVYLLERDAAGRRNRIIEVSTATGRQERVLYEQRLSRGVRGWEFYQLALDSTGTALMVVDQRGHVHLIDIATRRATTITPSGGPPGYVAW